MFLSVIEQNKLLKLIETLGTTLDSTAMREATGYILLDLLESDHFASFVWDENKKDFEKGIFINMSQSNLLNYNSHFKNHDPITNKLRVKKSAVRVNDILPQQEILMIICRLRPTIHE